ncbi:MAG: F-box protein [Holosporales bacterium]
MVRGKTFVLLSVFLASLSWAPLCASQLSERDAQGTPQPSLGLGALPEEIQQEVMGHLPAHAIARAGLVCHALQKSSQEALDQLVADCTFNRRLGAKETDLQGVPEQLVVRGLQRLMNTDHFIAVPINPSLDDVKIDDFETLREGYGMVYEALFHRPMPCSHLVDSQYREALSHLRMVFPLQRIWARNGEKDLALRQLKHRLEFILGDYKANTPYVTLQDLSQEAAVQAANQPFTLVVDDRDIQKPNARNIMSLMLQAQPDHHVILDMGVQPFINVETLRLDSSRLPGAVRHLTLTNQRGNAKKIGSGFLENAAQLLSLKIAFPDVVELESEFLMGCAKLTKIELNTPELRCVSYGFLEGCTSLESIDLYAPKLTTITVVKGIEFLKGCDRLSPETRAKMKDLLERHAKSGY